MQFQENWHMLVTCTGWHACQIKTYLVIYQCYNISLDEGIVSSIMNYYSVDRCSEIANYLNLAILQI